MRSQIPSSDLKVKFGKPRLGILQAGILQGVAIRFSRGSSSSGIEPLSLASQADSLPAEPQEKPKNTGVGKPIPSPTDLSNPGLELGSPAMQEI